MPRRQVSVRLAEALSIVAFFVAGGVLLQARPDPQDARSREREMYVSVTDRNGTPVTDLSVRDFVIREDGVAREVLAVREATDPITIALAVDNSQAATNVIPDIRTAVKAFVERMAAGRNPVAVMTVADRPTLVQDYTLVVPQAVQAAQKLFPVRGSGAQLLQALVDLSKGFAGRDFDRGVIVAISTEGREFSDLSEDQVLPALRRSGVSLNAFVFTFGATPDLRSQGERSRAVVLDAGPRDTGGRRVDLLSSMALEGALQKLGDQLSHEYRVTYSRPESMIPPEKVEVNVRRPGLDARGTPVRPRQS